MTEFEYEDYFSHYEEIENLIGNELADEEYYLQCEEEMQEELAWYNWARSMGYE